MSTVYTASLADRKGLVTSLKSDRSPPKSRYARVSIHADMLRVRVSSLSPDEEEAAELPRGDREAISRFSKRSRKALLERLAEIRDVTGGWFLTLTYPDEFPRETAEAKRHLANLRKRILRQYPEAGGIWRIEFKSRKSGENVGAIAPHFHLLVFGIITTSLEFRLWLRDAWYQVVDSGDQRHLYAGTQADEIKNRRHAMAYASKYVGKEGDDFYLMRADRQQNVGRFWASFGDLDLSPSLETWITFEQYVELKRLAGKLLKSRGNGYARRLRKLSSAVGFTLFGAGDDSLPEYGPRGPTVFRMLAAIV